MKKEFQVILWLVFNNFFKLKLYRVRKLWFVAVPNWDHKSVKHEGLTTGDVNDIVGSAPDLRRGEGVIVSMEMAPGRLPTFR